MFATLINKKREEKPVRLPNGSFVHCSLHVLVYFIFFHCTAAFFCSSRRRLFVFLFSSVLLFAPLLHQGEGEGGLMSVCAPLVFLGSSVQRGTAQPAVN